MRQSHLQRSLGISIAAAAVLLLALLMLGTVTSAAQPADADHPADPAAPADWVKVSSRLLLTEPREPIAPPWRERTRPDQVRRRFGADDLLASPGDLTIEKTVTTGSGDNGSVYNGDRITYTLSIRNSGASPAANIVIYDLLPAALDDTTLECTPVCSEVVEFEQIPTPLGGLTTVSVTVEVTWSIESLAPGAAVQRVFSARVVGQPDGAVINNTAELEYDEGIAISNETETTVLVRVDGAGGGTVADVPTWVSSDLGGTMSLDWGDFDGDGYLDLALGSTVGTSVYHNEGGHLAWCWGNEEYTLGVRWADFNGDGDLELVAVGKSGNNNSALAPGTNYVINLEADCATVATTTFASPHQLLRVEPGAYYRDGDSDIDLIASTNAISVVCPVGFYDNDGSGNFADDPDECISFEATANIAPADYVGDGSLDLALGVFPNTTRVWFGRPLVCGPPTPADLDIPCPPGYTDVDTSMAFLAYDFSWGDYDRDGYLDLAAAYPLDRMVRIYHNNAGAGFDDDPQELRTSLFRTPQALDWGDFNGDGYLDLAVADAPPRIYFNDQGSFSSDDVLVLSQEVAAGQIWALAAADADNDGDLDLALGNWKGASLLITSFGPFLDPHLTPVGGASPASGVAWGDGDGDGDQDLLLGSGGRTAYARLYLNQRGAFPTSVQLDSRYGPHDVAFGDVDGDGQLDVALGSVWLGDRIYLGVDRPATGEWEFSYSLPSSSYSVAWGDVEGDGDLDLLAGGEGPEYLFVNSGTALDTTPAWSSRPDDDTRSLAWGDYDGDGYADFATGNDGQPNRLYRNEKDRTFSLVWSSGQADLTRSVAWGDYDGDGDLDLAVGNYGQANLIYQNLGGLLDPTPIWQSEVSSTTTSLAWGDWDNDGDLDLAVGNDGQPDQVYSNQGSAPGAPRLLWLWTSADRLKTSDVAWGDRDGDGDLDLAISQTGTGWNGYYENGYVLPAHLDASAMPLPNNPSYLAIERPGVVDDAYYYSTWELLGYGPPPTDAVVTAGYTLFDPEGDDIAEQQYEYSLDGGGTWHEAGISTTTVSFPGPGMSQAASFEWNAQEVEAISDDARFRITIVHDNPVGPVQRAATSATSPPFRLRGTGCVWPVGPSFVVDPDPPQPGEVATFEGDLVTAEGPLAFTWDFGDGSTAKGQVVGHTYASGGLYLVRMTVATTAADCPPRVVKTSRIVRVGRGPVVHLPRVARSATISVGQRADLRGSWPMLESNPPPAPEPGSGQAEPTGGTPHSPPSDRAPLASDSGWPADRRPPGWRTAASAIPPGEPTSSTMAPAQVGSVFPDGVFITSAAETMTVTEGLDGIHSQPSIAGNGEPIAFWSTASRAPAQTDYVRISEIDPGGEDAIEFYNPSDTEVNMEGYKFTGIRSIVTRYTFPSFILQPGAFVVLHETYGDDTSTDLYMGRNIYWVHGYPGSASLVDAGGQGVDFVRWGNASDPPPPGTAWISPNPASPLESMNLGRDESGIDSNSGLDWCTQSPSLGVQNAACVYDASGNIEVFLAEELSVAVPSWKQVTFSTGNILGGFNLWPSINISGTRVAFFSDRDLTGENGDENFEIFAYDGTHADPFTQVTVSEGGVNIWPSTNVSGTRIAFASDRDLDPRRLNGDSNQEIFLAELADGGTVSITQVTVTRPPVINDEPFISGDGRRIAYARYGLTGFPHLWLYDVVSQGEDEIVAEGASVQPSLNYTGTRLAFVSTGNLDVRGWNPDKSREIFTAEISPGANPTPTFSQVTSATVGVVNDQPCICASGNRLAFVSGSDVWLYDDYGLPKAILLSTEGGSASRPSISGNGLYVAFAAANQIVRAFSPLTDLEATKRSEPDVVVPGQGITYVITFTNRGLDDIVGATVSDTIPAAVLSLQWDCSPASCTAPTSGQHLLDQTVDLPQGMTLVYTATGTLDPSATGTITNTAVVTPPGQITDQKPLNNTATVTDTLVIQADLVLSKSVDRDPVAAGEILTYTLDYTNDGGPSDAWDLVITDRLPFGVSFGGMESGPDPTSQQDGLLTWNIATLAVDDSDQLVFSATVASWLLSNTITNTAAITASSLDLDPGDNDDDLATTVTTSADLILAKTAQPDPVVAGSTLTYTLLYSNAGPSDAQEVHITDTLPVSVTWDGTVLAVDPPLYGPTLTAELNTWYWYTPVLPAGAAGVITFEVTVSEALAAPETIVNTAVIDSGTDDPRPRNNDDDAAVDVIIPVDLAVAKIAEPNPIDAGVDITFTITVSNLGSYPATNATVNDDIPEADIKDFRWTCESTSGSTCTAGPSGKEEDIDDTVTIAPGGLLTYTVIGEMKANAPSLVYNTATATAAVGFTDTNPLDNSDTSTSTVTTSADLEVSKSVDDDTPNVGDTIVYTLIVSNPVGPSSARNVVLTDVLPLGVEYVSHNAPRGTTYTPASGRWDVGTVDVGANRAEKLEVTVSVSDTGGITVVNIIDDLQSDSYDPDPTNNTDSVTITVNLPPEIEDQALPSVDEHSPTGTSVGTVVASDPNPGDTLAYGIVAGNTGSAFGVDSASGEITVDDNGALDHHTHPTFTLTVEVTDAGGLTASAVVTIPVADISPDVTVGKTADPASLPEPGGTVTFTVSVTSNTGEPVTVTHLVDDLHGNLSNQGDCGTPWVIDGSDACTFTAAVNGDVGYSETDVVTATVQDNEGNTDTPGDSATVSITDLLPDIAVSKTADPADPLEPGGTVTFTVIVTNTTVETATLTLLTDDLHGNLNGQGTCATGGTIPGDTSYSCAFSVTVSGDAGESETDTVTATVRDDENNTDTQTASATVTISDVVPSITVTKTADPTSVPETGGTVTFTVSVTLNSTEAVTLTSLIDDLHGDLNGQGDCAVPRTIAGGLSYSCTFTATVAGSAPGSETDTVTATVQDDDSNDVEASDDATVTFSDALPGISVSKTASAAHVLEPGGTVTFTVIVTNNTSEAARLTYLRDDVHGDLDGKGTCSEPRWIAGNASYSCWFTASVSGSAGESETGTVEARARDDENNRDDDTASATVTVVPFHLAITGPLDGLINTNYTFTATVHPTASLPVTYTWRASGKGSQAHPSRSRLTDTISYTWSDAGTKYITVTAACLSGTMTSTYSLPIYGSLRAMAWGLFLEPIDWFHVYLPLVLKGEGH